MRDLVDDRQRSHAQVGDFDKKEDRSSREIEHDERSNRDRVETSKNEMENSKRQMPRSYKLSTSERASFRSSYRYNDEELDQL